MYARPISTRPALLDEGGALTKQASVRNHPMLRLAPLAALLIAANARAKPRIPHPARLEYIRGEGTHTCAGEGTLRHVILSRMKEDPFSPTAQAKARVVIVRVGSAFQASYELLDDAEEFVAGQTLPRRDDCLNALEDVGLAMSVHMPLLLTDSTPQPPALASQAAASSPLRTELPPRKPPRAGGGSGGGGRGPSAKPAHPLGWRIDGGVLVSRDTAPATAFGLSLHAGPRWWFLSLSAGVRLDFSLSDGTATGQVSAWRTLAEVVPCLHMDLDDIAILGCGVVQAGQFTAKGKMADYTRTVSAPNVSAGGRFVIEMPHLPFFRRGLAPFVSIDILGAVRRTSIFLADHPRYEWFAPPITWAAAIGWAFSR